jgi:hypothetical protein
MTEYELVQSVASHLRKHFPTMPFVIEAPVLGRSADLVMIKANKVISIEFKLRDFRRGIVQARDYCLASDFSYVCLLHMPHKQEIFDHARHFGVGVLTVDLKSKWPFKTLSRAKPSREKWMIAAKALRNYVLKESNGKNSIL